MFVAYPKWISYFFFCSLKRTAKTCKHSLRKINGIDSLHNILWTAAIKHYNYFWIWRRPSILLTTVCFWIEEKTSVLEKMTWNKLKRLFKGYISACENKEYGEYGIPQGTVLNPIPFLISKIKYWVDMGLKYDWLGWWHGHYI